MMTIFYPKDQLKAPLKLLVTRNNGTIDQLDVTSVAHAESIADMPPGFKAATLWANVDGRGFGLVGVNK